MPELPEVEAIRRKLEKAVVGKTIRRARASDDPIVFQKVDADAIEKALVGRRVVAAQRKGKFWWLEFDNGRSLCGHLGMSGWVHFLDKGEAEPRFQKLVIEIDGLLIAFTDRRRLGRIWLCDSPGEDKRVASLGRDVMTELPSQKELQTMLQRRKAPIKALLLDQGLFAGVGNYMADDILYQARIAPKRPGGSLSEDEVRRLRAKIKWVTEKAVDAAAADRDPPAGWLFHVRWGRRKTPPKIRGHAVVRETVGGRTTAWVPDLQK